MFPPRYAIILVSQVFASEAVTVSVALATDVNEELLQRVSQSLSLVADLSRADAVLYRLEDDRARIVAQARPHSVPPVWRDEILGSVAQLETGGVGARALQRRLPAT